MKTGYASGAYVKVFPQTFCWGMSGTSVNFPLIYALLEIMWAIFCEMTLLSTFVTKAMLIAPSLCVSSKFMYWFLM